MSSLEKNAEKAYADKKFSEALALYQAIFQEQPDNLAAARGILNCFHALQQYQACEDAARAMLAVHSDFVDAWVMRGVALAEQQRWTESLAALQEAIRLEPRNWLAFRNLEAIYGKMGRKLDAAQAALKVFQLRPGFKTLADALLAYGSVQPFGVALAYGLLALLSTQLPGWWALPPVLILVGYNLVTAIRLFQRGQQGLGLASFLASGLLLGWHLIWNRPF